MVSSSPFGEIKMIVGNVYQVTGGAPAINGQVFLRGVPEDYDSWASEGNDQWNFQKLIPYFNRVETDPDFPGDFHGSEGPIIMHRFKRETWLPAQTFRKRSGTLSKQSRRHPYQYRHGLLGPVKTPFEPDD